MQDAVSKQYLFEKLLQEQKDYFEIIKNAKWDNFQPASFNDGIEAAKDIIHNAPIVVRKAHWDSIRHRSYKCSFCGNEPLQIENDIPVGNYCVWCGCEMERIEKYEVIF